jgi:hypothetical protein
MKVDIFYSELMIFFERYMHEIELLFLAFDKMNSKTNESELS